MKILIIILSTLASLAHGQDADKVRLSEQQQLRGIGQSFVKPTAMPVNLPGGGSLVYRQGGEYFVFDIEDGVHYNWKYTKPVTEREFPFKVEGWKNPTYSPDLKRIAYTLDNDLYSMDAATGAVTRHTWDGSDLILNGYASWVYYEEILGRPSHYKAFWWSPDSKVIAFYRFDNSGVPMFPIYHSDGLYGSLDQTRYPKAGDRNPAVRVGFVSASGGETMWADFDRDRDQYFGIPFWNGDGDRFMVAWMPRSQDDLTLYAVNPADGTKEVIYNEHQNCWIDWLEQMLFTRDGIYIVRDFTGWQQIYFLSYDGKRFERLSDGNNWSIRLLKANDRFLFFTAKRESSVRENLYRISLRSGKIDRICRGDCTVSNVKISEDCRDFAWLASNTRTPFQLQAVRFPQSGSMAGARYRTVFDSRGVDFGKYAYAHSELIDLKMRDGVVLPALVVWPVDFDPQKKYPVIASIYGGPDSPRVRDRWQEGCDQWWANHGVIQVVFDNRASGHLGKRGIEAAYRNLGRQEMEDFCDCMKAFTELPFVDAAKTGVYGFSFGGTMTTRLVTEGNAFFKYGIAGGGVYDWALYDTHYTERYMDTPADNPDGYASSRVLDRLDGYRGDATNMLRITHGTADDNVHFQNTLQLIDALQDMGKEFELMIYPQEYHGYKGMKKVHSQMSDYTFWYRYLFGEPLPDALREFFKPASKTTR